MLTREGLVKMKGQGLTLLGDEVKVGQKAPDFKTVQNDMSIAAFSQFIGKVCIICSVPSLDTAVCDTQTRKFNERTAELGESVVVLTVSMDLPFAQKRWCGSAGVENVVVVSDHRDAEFGTKYGLLIKELRLLARAVFVVDKAGTIRYIQIVDEITNEPDYDKALEVVKGLLYETAQS